MLTINPKYANRRTYYLRDLIEGRGYFAGEQDVAHVITTTMKEDNPNGLENSSQWLSHAILDVKDVIFPPRVEQLLYDWISYYDLVVIDTTVEERDNIIPINKGQYLPDGTKATENTQIELKAGDPIMFRHKALMQYRERVEFSRKSLDLSMFEHTVGDVRRFTTDSSRDVLQALKEIQTAMQNQNDRMYVNPSKINYKDEQTLREVSALLIRLYKHVKVANNHLNMTPVKEGILPAIGQLCFNYESFISTLIDIKYKFKVGDKLPIIYGKEIYFVTVTENPAIPQDLDIMSLTEEDIEKYFYISVRDVNVNERLEVIFDDNEEEKRKVLEKELKKELETAKEKGYHVLESDSTKKAKILSDLNGNPFELVVNAERIKRREVIFLPPAIAGMRDSDGNIDETGMPTNEQLKYNYTNSIIGAPSMIWVDPNDFVYASTQEDLSAGADFIKVCREQEQLSAKRRGEEKKFVDFIELFSRM